MLKLKNDHSRYNFPELVLLPFKTSTLSFEPGSKEMLDYFKTKLTLSGQKEKHRKSKKQENRPVHDLPM